MRHCIVLLCLLFATSLYGQDSLEIKSYYGGYYKDHLKTCYSVLKSDTAVKNGLFKSYFLLGCIESNGRYDNNKRVGIWEFYDKKTCKPYLIFNFDNRYVILHIQRMDENIEKPYCSVNGILTTLDMVPIFPECEPYSLNNFCNYIADLVVKNNLSASLTEDFSTEILFAIDTTGSLHAERYMAERYGVSELDNKIITLFNSIKGWLPAEVNGKKVECGKYKIPIVLRKNTP